jgi:hypothetical protein
MQVHCVSLPLLLIIRGLLKLKAKLLLVLLNPKPSCFGIKTGSGESVAAKPDFADPPGSPVPSASSTESVINFVDLAGSESAEEAGTTGDVRAEGIFINKR